MPMDITEMEEDMILTGQQTTGKAIRLCRHITKTAFAVKTACAVKTAFAVLAVAGLAFTGLLQPASAQIDEITVTAQKRAENLQDVPVSINALSGDMLDERGVAQINDILEIFPNLNHNAANEINTGFTIRGVGSNNFHGNAVRSVGIYQDEVSLSTPFSGVLGVFDMERVEVLRGPQNSLFGRNTTGGAINYISTKPDVGGPANGYTTATFGSHNQVDVVAAYGASLSDSFAIRFAGESRTRDGLFTNQAPGREGEEMGTRDRYSWRLQGLWEVSDATELLLNYHAARNNGKNIGNKGAGIRDPNDITATCPNLPTSLAGYERVSDCVTAFGFNPSTADWHTVYNVSPAIQQVEIDGFFAKITHNFANDILLTYIGAYDETTVLQSDDNSGGNMLAFIPNQDGEYEQTSHELRLQGDGEMYRWIVGTYIFVEDQRLATIVRRDANLQVNPMGLTGPGQVTAYNFLEQEDEELSLYGQFEYDVTADTTLTLGLRFTDNTKDALSRFGVMQAPIVAGSWGLNEAIPLTQVLSQSFIENQLKLGEAMTAGVGNQAAVAQFNVCRNVATGADFKCSGSGDNAKVLLSAEEWGGKFGVDHRLNPDTLIFASYSRGFKSGNHDTRALAATNPLGGAPVSVETLDAYELGVKWENADRTLRINGAIFQNIWTDHQMFGTLDGIPAIYNIPEVEINGLELEATYAPDETWIVTANLGMLDSEITDNSGLIGENGVALADKGHPSRNVPEMSANMTVSKDIMFGSDMLNLFASASWRDEMYDTLIYDNREYYRHPDYFRLDIRATYEFGMDGRYSVSLWGENLTDERQCYDIGSIDAINDASITSGQLSSATNCSPSDGEALYGITARVNF